MKNGTFLVFSGRMGRIEGCSTDYYIDYCAQTKEHGALEQLQQLLFHTRFIEDHAEIRICKVPEMAEHLSRGKMCW